MLRRLFQALTIALACSATGASAHGYMNNPMARNVQRGPPGDMHSLSCGGTGAVWDDGRVKYSESNPFGRCDRCGSNIAEPKPRAFEEGGKFATPPKIAAHYSPGSAIDIEIVIKVSHGGRFSFRLCAAGNPSSQDCYNQNILKGTSGSPYYYIRSEGAKTYRFQYILPMVSCERCVLQWLYLTANSCTPPGTPADYIVGHNMGDCGSGSAASPEIFVNCADIRIGAGGKTLVASPAANNSGVSLSNSVNGFTFTANGTATASTTNAGGTLSPKGDFWTANGSRNVYVVGGVASCGMTTLLLLLLVLVLRQPKK